MYSDTTGGCEACASRELMENLSARKIGRVLAERGRKIHEMLLLLPQDFADVFGDRILAERFALHDAIAVGANGVALVGQIGAEHLLGLLRLLYWFRCGSRHASEIV